MTIHYELYNNDDSDKPTLLLIHGFLSSTFSFRRLIPLLARDYTVIAIDFPPFGKSGKSKNFTYSYENIAKTILLFIETLALTNLIVIGHSMGGQLGLQMAKQQPEMVEKLILLCSSSYLKPTKKSLRYASYIPLFHHYVKFWLAKKGVINNLLNVVYDQSMIDEEMIEGYRLPFENQEIFIGMTKLIQDREGELSSEDLQGITTPCLLIWGEHDRVVPLHIGKKLHQDLPNSSLIVFRDTGHLVPEEKPEDVVKHVKQFITVSSRKGTYQLLQD
ncbi:alpha/beta fold hydrolase [Bacillus sp. PS06]|uniref:alpha/beta fold hydrolase n=1 Tax=Bacillus sp. PS06 TaxID=2764176 RepID=UPI00177FBC33|nr:alpha/beta hydrolase [Bacillus sp. PS06]MBD8070502.1 alpha/beta hydrolase [Bacillus sp. PS06]